MSLLKRASAFAFVATAFAAACGPSGDDTDASTDAQSDQSITDATKDAPSTDAAKDVTVTDSASDSASDSATDSASDSASDSGSDSAIDATKDAPVDATKDVSVVDSGGCTLNSECSIGYFCKKPDGDCGGSDGACAVIPSICNSLYNPVCGCDKKTYSNECHANGASQNAAYTGTCE